MVTGQIEMNVKVFCTAHVPLNGGEKEVYCWNWQVQFLRSYGRVKWKEENM